MCPECSTIRCIRRRKRWVGGRGPAGPVLRHTGGMEEGSWTTQTTTCRTTVVLYDRSVARRLSRTASPTGPGKPETPPRPVTSSPDSWLTGFAPSDPTTPNTLTTRNRSWRPSSEASAVALTVGTEFDRILERQLGRRSAQDDVVTASSRRVLAPTRRGPPAPDLDGGRPGRVGDCRGPITARGAGDRRRASRRVQGAKRDRMTACRPGPANNLASCARFLRLMHRMCPECPPIRCIRRRKRGFWGAGRGGAGRGRVRGGRSPRRASAR